MREPEKREITVRKIRKRLDGLGNLFSNRLISSTGQSLRHPRNITLTSHERREWIKGRALFLPFFSPTFFNSARGMSGEFTIICTIITPSANQIKEVKVSGPWLPCCCCCFFRCCCCLHDFFYGVRGEALGGGGLCCFFCYDQDCVLMAQLSQAPDISIVKL